MDSYFRDSARSPGDRWSSRDETRIKDERGDNFYRGGRSPGTFLSLLLHPFPYQPDAFHLIALPGCASDWRFSS